MTGQGIGRYETDHLQRELKRRNLDSTVERSLGNDTDLSLAGRHEVHKDSQRNVLVCDVRQVGAGRYQAGLYIDNDNELVLDHATGRHIPGMVVMEATRQMARVSAERQLDGRTTGGGYQWVVHSCNTEFRGFLFPLPVLLECEISQAGRHRPNQSRFQATVSLCQGGRATVVSTMEFAAYRERTLERAERMQATRAVQETVANLSARPS
ncbi:hypothetical protein CC117_23300 [Parafrankia colletiae]|uniref:A-factor biosynthesis hotdog domain-containing protein n=1 Tax=Parafrankia colletiae TaxID=573497 RepID=A0A1S1QJN4_9ACTN|nr:hypothetical protein CC117_23300 [Parafrankia colletiae]